MKRALTILASVLFVTRAGAQAAVVTRSATLRAGPSRSWPIKGKLHPDDELLVVHPDQKNGYYEVRAADGEPGWVWARDVRIADLVADSYSQDAGASLVAYVVDVRNDSDGTLKGHWMRFAGRPFWDVEYVQQAGGAPCSFLMNSR